MVYVISFHSSSFHSYLTTFFSLFDDLLRVFLAYLTLRAAGGGSGSCLAKLCKQLAASSSEDADLVSTDDACKSAMAAAAAAAATLAALPLLVLLFLLSLAILSMASCLAFHLSMRDWVRRLPDLWSSASSSLALEAELPDRFWARSPDCDIELVIRDSSICNAVEAVKKEESKIKHTVTNSATTLLKVSKLYPILK